MAIIREAIAGNDGRVHCWGCRAVLGTCRDETIELALGVQFDRFARIHVPEGSDHRLISGVWRLSKRGRQRLEAGQTAGWQRSTVVAPFIVECHQRRCGRMNHVVAVAGSIDESGARHAKR